MADDHNNAVHAVMEKKANFKRWDVHDKPAGLAVSSFQTILVTFSDASKVEEYAMDGTLMRKVPLDPTIVHPRHAITLSDGQLIVCHGSADDIVHRVCAVDSTGEVVRSYGHYRGQGLGHVKTPTRLANSNSSIYVSDLNNTRILVLSPTLNHKGVIVSRLTAPYRLWLDNEADRLYVADNKWENNSWVAGKLDVYDVSGVDNRSRRTSCNNSRRTCDCMPAQQQTISANQIESPDTSLCIDHEPYVLKMIPKWSLGNASVDRTPQPTNIAEFISFRDAELSMRGWQQLYGEHRPSYS